MARFWGHKPWRLALSAGTVCGLTLGSVVLGADPPRGASDSSDAQPPKSGNRTVLRESDLDAAIQQLGVNTAKPGSSSYSQRKRSLSELPLDQLNDSARAKTKIVLSDLAMFRRLPTLTFEVDPEIYTYFLSNPDVAVANWRAMDISKFQLKEVEPNCFAADAGDGSVGRIEILHRTPDEMLIYCDGAFKSPLLPKPIIARSLMHLQTSFAREADGRIICTHTGDVFVEFPSQTIETVAKVIAPVSHSIADRNFKQMTLFVHLMTQAMAKHPGWVEMIGNKLEGVTAQQRSKYMEVTAHSHAVARKRMTANLQNKPFVPEEILTPFKQSNEPNSLPAPISSRPGTGTSRN